MLKTKILDKNGETVMIINAVWAKIFRQLLFFFHFCCISNERDIKIIRTHGLTFHCVQQSAS